MWATLSLTPIRSASGKPVLTKADNRRLCDWQREHMRTTWVVRTCPWEVEYEVIALLRPPLNSAANAAHPFYPRVRAARAAFRALAGEI